MWPFRRPAAAAPSDYPSTNASPLEQTPPEELVLAGAARELSRLGLGTGIFDQRMAKAIVGLVSDSGLLSDDQRFSVDIVAADSGAWRFGASTDPSVNSREFFAPQLGLTGWLIRSRRRILHIVSRYEIPTDVVAVKGYGDVESAFVYMVRLDGDAAACLCLVSSRAAGIPAALRDTLHRLGKLVEVLAAHEIEPTQLQRSRTVYAVPALRDAHVIDDWISDRLSSPFKWATFWRWHGNRGELLPSAFSREIKPWAGVMRPLKLGEGFTGQCAQMRRVILENVVTNGVGEKTKLRTPLIDISPGTRLRSILTSPVQDGERFYGVVTILGDTVHHFHDDDLLAANVVAGEIASVLRRIDDRKLLELQHQATANLLSTLNDATPPPEYWPVLQRSLQTIVDSGVSTDAFLLIRKRSTGAKYSVKVAATADQTLVGSEFDLVHDEVLRGIARADHGEIDLGRLHGRRADHPLIAAQGRAWIATYSVAERGDLPLFLAVLLLASRSVYSEPFGERQLDHLFEHVTASAFAYTKVVLMASDFAEVTRTHSQLIVSETHDIAQQLTSIKHAAERVLEKQPLTAELTRIVAAADDLLVRIDNMMYQNWFVRSGISVSGPTAPFDEPQPVNIIELVDGVLSTVRSQHPECVFTFETHDIQPGVEYLVFGRYRWLAVAIRNVLDNAQKFGRSSPVEVRLEYVAAAVPDGDSMLIAVRDHGIGIPTDERKAIFQPGHRNPYSRRLFVGGSQIALSVTQDIVQEHHGAIWVESQLRRGSTFYIRFPRYRREVLDEDSVG